MYIHYGCGLTAPQEWENFDVSPTLRIQKKLPLLKRKLHVNFPKNVNYGNIVKGLPVKKGSANGVFCSHVLEHLSLEDFRIALYNTYEIMREGGAFRLVMPDLHFYVETYLREKAAGKSAASINFIENTILGQRNRPRGIKDFVRSFVGNSHHLWLWDYEAVEMELEKVGFQNIRPCQFGDAEDKMFTLVEDKNRFNNALAVEAKK